MKRAAVAYLAAAALFTFPLVLHPASRLAARHGPGDPYLNLWILGWDLETISRDPGALVTGRIFDANIFHPSEGTLTYSDHFILQALAMWPLYAMTRDVVLCYNALFVLSLIASALAMHIFVYRVTGSRAGATLAGLVWGFWPFHFAHLVHIQLQALYGLPLAFLCLHRVMARGRWRDAAALGVAAALQAASSVYYGVIGAVGLAVAAVVLAVGIGRWRSARLASRLLGAAIAGAVLVAPFVWPYLRTQQREGFTRNLYAASRGAASVSSYARTPDINLVYGRTGLLFRAPLPGEGDQAEQELFPGVIVVALACFGLARARRGGSWPTALAMTALIALGFVLSLGPEGARPLYAALYRGVFGFEVIRAPARFSVLVTFGLAVLAAIGLRHAIASPPASGLPPPTSGLRPRPFTRRLLAAGCLAAAALEYANAPIPYVPAPPRETPVGQWLRRAPEPGAVLYLPLYLDRENTPFMVQSLEHLRPIVNGYSGQRPSLYTALVDTIRQLPSDESLLVLKTLNVRFLVAPQALVAASDAGSPLLERARLDDGVIYELRWTPEIEARLERSEAPLPPPGPIPFGTSETMVYEARWVSGPMRLAAGEATIVVTPPRYTFVASARTADWVSQFFEADDRFETRADDLLRPLVHERRLREGRRRLDRRIVYDHERRVVRVGDDLTLPIAPGARDPLTAFFYARTLPLTPGFHVRIPVNDAGRNLVVDLTCVGLEPIASRDGEVNALRVEARLISQVERRQSIAMTLWIGDDRRRVPLAVEVSAGFGRVRLELTSYRGEDARR